jgi:hypothetical protein
VFFSTLFGILSFSHPTKNLFNKFGIMQLNFLKFIFTKCACVVRSKQDKVYKIFINFQFSHCKSRLKIVF